MAFTLSGYSCGMLFTSLWASHPRPSGFRTWRHSLSAFVISKTYTFLVSRVLRSWDSSARHLSVNCRCENFAIGPFALLFSEAAVYCAKTLFLFLRQDVNFIAPSLRVSFSKTSACFGHVVSFVLPYSFPHLIARLPPRADSLHELLRSLMCRIRFLQNGFVFGFNKTRRSLRVTSIWILGSLSPFDGCPNVLFLQQDSSERIPDLVNFSSRNRSAARFSLGKTIPLCRSSICSLDSFLKMTWCRYLLAYLVLLEM